MPTAVIRAVDIQPVLEGVAAVLAANSVIVAQSARVVPDDDVAGGTFPYLAYSVTSDLTDNTYSHSAVNLLVTVTAIDKAQSTTKVRLLAAAAQTALLDTAWTATGFTIMGKSRESARYFTEVTNGATYRYRATMFRIRALQN